MNTYPLNISPRYVSNWGAWEAAREVICNAIDADPSYKVSSPEGDILIVETSTAPSIAQLMMIGEGTKSVGNETIGQFGEGFKLAALTVTRDGGDVTVELADQVVRFDIEEIAGIGSDGLVAKITRQATGVKGCRITLRMQGIGHIWKGRILEDRAEGPRSKMRQSSMRVYCKGVFINDFDAKSLRDWNLNRLTINRDRDLATESNVRSAIYSWLETNSSLDDEFVTRMAFETEGSIYIWGDARQRLCKAWYRKHGDNAVLSVDDKAINSRAEKAGYKLVPPANDLVKQIGLQTAEDVAPRYELESLPVEPYRESIARLRRLDEIVGAPGLSILVFDPGSIDLFGLAEIGERRIWLSCHLFSPGREFDLTRTYLHEIAHFLSGGADDYTALFEHTLDGVAASLAMKLLEGQA